MSEGICRETKVYGIVINISKNRRRFSFTVICMNFLELDNLALLVWLVVQVFKVGSTTSSEQDTSGDDCSKIRLSWRATAVSC